MLRSLRLAALAAIALSVTACSSGDPDEPDPVETPPSFSIASTGVTCDSGAACLQFSFIPSENVEITEVLIRNPRAQTERFNGNNNVFLSSTSYQLQENNVAFTRVSGGWQFTFNGRRAGGSQASFAVTVPLDVSAVQAETPIAVPTR